MKTATKTRARRSAEDRIADLQKKIESIKTRAERKKVAKDPALRYLRSAIKSIDKALGESEDAVMRKELEEARSTLSACMSLNGVVVPPTTSKGRGRRSRGDLGDLEERLLEHLGRHPGQRGEQIAAELGTDSTTMRGPMKRLIKAGKVRTTGQRRAMAYSLS